MDVLYSGVAIAAAGRVRDPAVRRPDDHEVEPIGFSLRVIYVNALRFIVCCPCAVVGQGGISEWETRRFNQSF